MIKLGVLSILLIGVLGCAVLNQSTIEIDPSRLTSQTNPELVDGNLETVSTFALNGHVEKGYEVRSTQTARGVNSDELRYVTSIKGGFRTEAVIKLDAPTYITYIEIYPESRIPKLALVTTLDDPPKFERSFEVVRDKQHINVESKQPVKIQINREVLYLRITADGIQDKKNSVRVVDDKSPFGNRNKKIVQNTDTRIQIPLKGASIREVKFYAREKL